MTDRRLSHGQALRRPGQALFGHHGIEDPEQIQIEMAEVHGGARGSKIYDLFISSIPTIHWQSH
jgi:hypothetical protein